MSPMAPMNRNDSDHMNISYSTGVASIASAISSILGETEFATTSVGSGLASAGIMDQQPEEKITVDFADLAATIDCIKPDPAGGSSVASSLLTNSLHTSSFHSAKQRKRNTPSPIAGGNRQHQRLPAEEEKLTISGHSTTSWASGRKLRRPQRRQQPQDDNDSEEGDDKIRPSKQKQRISPSLAASALSTQQYSIPSHPPPRRKEPLQQSQEELHQAAPLYWQRPPAPKPQPPAQPAPKEELHNSAESLATEMPPLVAASPPISPEFLTKQGLLGRQAPGAPPLSSPQPTTTARRSIAAPRSPGEDIEPFSQSERSSVTGPIDPHSQSERTYATGPIEPHSQSELTHATGPIGPHSQSELTTATGPIEPQPHSARPMEPTVAAPTAAEATGARASTPAESSAASSEVDYYRSPTILSRLILHQRFEAAMDRLHRVPQEASVWVVAKREIANIITKDSAKQSAYAYSIRQLPLHIACSNLKRVMDPGMRGILNDLITNLVVSNPTGCREADHNGKYPLHQAIWGGASSETISMLLMAWPESCRLPDKRGRTPLKLNHHRSEPAGSSPKKQVQEILELDVDFWVSAKEEAAERLKQTNNSEWPPQEEAAAAARDGSPVSSASSDEAELKSMQVESPSGVSDNKDTKSNAVSMEEESFVAQQDIEPMAWEQLEERALALEQVLVEANETNFQLNQRIDALTSSKLEHLDKMDAMQTKSLVKQVTFLQEKNKKLRKRIRELEEQLQLDHQTTASASQMSWSSTQSDRHHFLVKENQRLQEQYDELQRSYKEQSIKLAKLQAMIHDMQQRYEAEDVDHLMTPRSSNRKMPRRRTRCSNDGTHFSGLTGIVSALTKDSGSFWEENEEAVVDESAAASSGPMTDENIGNEQDTQEERDEHEENSTYMSSLGMGTFDKAGDDENGTYMSSLGMGTFDEKGERRGGRRPKVEIEWAPERLDMELCDSLSVIFHAAAMKELEGDDEEEDEYTYMDLEQIDEVPPSDTPDVSGPSELRGVSSPPPTPHYPRRSQRHLPVMPTTTPPSSSYRRTSSAPQVFNPHAMHEDQPEPVAAPSRPKPVSYRPRASAPASALAAPTRTTTPARAPYRPPAPYQAYQPQPHRRPHESLSADGRDLELPALLNDKDFTPVLKVGGRRVGFGAVGPLPSNVTATRL